MKRPQNNNNDDFDFDFGGGDELFPLEPTSNSEQKAPKGVIGYAKNVVKSVKNLGVKTSKVLYPEAFALAEKFTDTEGDKTTVKGIITKYTGLAKQYGKEGLNIAKDIANDAKQAVKTGYFVKTEDEDQDMGNMFGDLFGDDDFSIGSGGKIDFGNKSSTIDEDFSYSEGEESSGDSLNIGETVVKSGVMGARATLHMGNKQIAATMGATQAQIKHDTALFSSQLTIQQEHHRQKMKAFSNISNNIGKIIQQNNASIRAQMEYSAKSLAFAQDTAAMIKEIRNAQWKMISPEKIEKKQNKGLFSSVFGDSGKSFNKKAFFDNYKNVASANAFGGAIDGIKMAFEMLGMFEDMGMTKSQGIRSMLPSMILESGINAIIGGQMYRAKEGFNRRIAGIPGAINRKLAKMASPEFSISNSKGFEALTKIPLLGKFLADKGTDIDEIIRNHSGYAHVSNQVRTNSGKYTMGDPNAIHPFDNKAHKVLTEVIPAYLSKMEAGINHHEETYFNFKTNSFKTNSSISKKIENDLQQTLEYSEGYSSARSNYTEKVNGFINSQEYHGMIKDNHDGILTGDRDKDDKIFDKNFNKMLHNLLLIGKDFGTVINNIIDELKSVDHYGFGETTSRLLNDTSFQSDIDKKIGIMMFKDTLLAMKNAPRGSDDRESYVNLQIASDAYAQQLSETYTQNEDYFGQMGNSIVYDKETRSKEVEKLIKQEMKKVKQLGKAYNTIKDKPGTTTLQRRYLDQRSKHLANIRAMKQEMSGEIIGSVNDNLYNMEDLEGDISSQYTMMSMKDSSTHGLVNNIYQLLLDGIGVYTIKNPKEAIKNAETRKGMRKKFFDDKIEEEKQEKEKTFYQLYGVPDYMYNKNGKIKATVYYKDEESGEYTAISGNVKDFIEKNPDITLYMKANDYFFIENQYKREAGRSSFGETPLENSWIRKIPGMNSFINMFNDINTGISNMGSAALGKTFYGEDDDIFTPEQQQKIADWRKKGLDAVEIAKKMAKDKDFRKEQIDNWKKKAIDLKDQAKDTAIDAKNSTIKFVKDEEYRKEKIDELKDTASKKYDEITDQMADFAAKKVNEVKDSELYKDAQGKIVKAKESNIYQKGYSVMMKAALSFGNAKLENITIDKKKLKDVVAKSGDSALVNAIKEAKDPLDKVDVLLKSENPNIAPFMGKLREFKEEILTLKNGRSPSMFIMKSVKDSIVKRTKSGALKALVKLQTKILTTELKKMKVGTVTLDEAVSKITNPALSKQLELQKDPVGKAKLLLAASETETSLVPFKAKLQEFVELGQSQDHSSISGTLNSFINPYIEKTLNKVENKLINKILDKDFDKIALGDKKLTDVVAKLCNDDPILAEKLKLCKNATEKAHILLRLEDDEIKPFKPLLRKFEEDNKDKNIVEIVSNKAINAASAAMEWLKKRIFNEKEETKNITRVVNKNIIDAFGGEENCIAILDKAGISEDDMKHLNMDPVKQAEFILENGGKPIKKFKKALKNVIKSAQLKRETRSTLASLDKQKNDKLTLIEDEKDEFAKGFMSNDIEAEYEKKKQKILAKRDKKLKKYNDDSVINSVEEQNKAKIDKTKQKEEDKRTNALVSIADFLKGAKKDGLNLSRKTLDKIEDANEKGAASGAAASGSGITGFITNLMDKTGLSKTKAGQQIKGAIGGIGSALGAVSGAITTGKTVLGGLAAKGGAVGTAATKAGGILGKVAGVGGKLLGGAGKVAGGAGKLALGAGKTAVGAGKLAAGIGKVGIGVVKVPAKILAFPIKLITKFLTNPTVSKMLGKKALKQVIAGFTKGIAKAAGKVMGKLMALTGLSATGVGIAIPITMAVVSFGKGMAEAKKHFSLGQGIKPTIGMRVAAGLAQGLDSLLMGIPGIIAHILGFPNVVQMIYNWIGDDTERKAMLLYKKYNAHRAFIFGIDDPQALIKYENRNGVDRAARGVMSTLTFGLMGSNDEKDAELLGFRSVKVFKYWRDKKYKPLSEMRIQIAEKYGGIKEMEQMVTADKNEVDKDEDGNIDESEEGNKYLEAMKKQQTYRKEYLETAKKWVVDNNLAWLRSSVTDELFKKMTGEVAGRMETTGEKAKKLGKKAAIGAAALAVGGPVGVLAVVAGKGLAKQFNGHIKDITGIDLSQHKGLKNKAKAILQTAGALAKRSIDKANTKIMKNKVNANLNILTEIWAKVVKDKRLKQYEGKERTVKAMARLIKAASKYMEDHHKYGESLNKKLDGFKTQKNKVVDEMVKLFEQNMNKIDTNIGVTVQKDMITPFLKLASGMIGVLTAMLPELNEACSSMFQKTMKLVIYEMVGKGMMAGGKIMSTFEKYLSEKAKILGIRIDKMEEFERRIAETANIFTQAWTGLTNFFGGGADQKNAAILGFESVEVYKYWKSKRYDPVKQIEMNIASKYGSYEDLTDKDTKNTEQQQRFIEEFLRVAGNYVNKSGIAWLTYKTTLKEFEERKANNKLTDTAVGYQAVAKATAKKEQEEHNKREYSLWERLWGVDKKEEAELNRKFEGDASNVVNHKNINIDPNKEVEAITKDLYKAYGYSSNGTTAMNLAGEEIANIWKAADKDFYTPGGVKPIPSAEGVGKHAPIEKTDSTSIGVTGDMDGGSSRPIASSKSSTKTTTSTSSTKGDKGGPGDNKETPAISSYDMNGKVPKAKIMNSIVKDFNDRFGKELNEKLNMLNEIHKEQLRHNDISEKFFASALQMMAMIAQKNGNTNISTKLDKMMREIVK